MSHPQCEAPTAWAGAAAATQHAALGRNGRNSVALLLLLLTCPFLTALRELRCAHLACDPSPACASAARPAPAGLRGRRAPSGLAIPRPAAPAAGPRPAAPTSAAAAMVRWVARSATLVPLSALENKREAVRHFTPSWFTVVMSTGIVGQLIGEWVHPAAAGSGAAERGQGCLNAGGRPFCPAPLLAQATSPMTPPPSSRSAGPSGGLPLCCSASFPRCWRAGGWRAPAVAAAAGLRGAGWGGGEGVGGCLAHALSASASTEAACCAPAPPLQLHFLLAGRAPAV